MEKGSKKRKPEILYSKILYRVTGEYLAKKLMKTRITPNQITISGFTIGIIAFILFLFGNYFYTILGMLLLQIRVILDHADGFLARMKSMESRFGGFLDFTTERIIFFLIFFGIGWGLYNSTGNAFVWFLCFFILGIEFLYDSHLLSIRLIFLPNSSKVLRKIINKWKFFKILIYTPFHVYLLGIVMAILNQMFLYLIITSIYILSFFCAETLYFCRKFRKMKK